MNHPPGLARTVVASASHVEVGIMGHRAPLAAHAVDEGGALLSSLGEAAPECTHLVRPGTSGPVVHAVATDVSGVAHAGRVRGRVTLSGRAEVLADPVDVGLRAHLGLAERSLVARLEPTEVTLEWSVESGRTARPAVDVDPGDYAAAEPDPLAGWADGWLVHLDSAHRDSLRELVADAVQPVAVVRPVHADADGIVLREHVGVSRRDIRVPFPRAVRCGCEAIQALRVLISVGTLG